MRRKPRATVTAGADGIGSSVDGETGAVTALQRFASAINLNVHFHTLVRSAHAIARRLRDVSDGGPGASAGHAFVSAAARASGTARDGGGALAGRLGDGGRNGYSSHCRVAVVVGRVAIGRASVVTLHLHAVTSGVRVYVRLRVDDFGLHHDSSAREQPHSDTNHHATLL